MAIQRSSHKRLNEVILALNAGSSSLKFGLFEYPEGGSAPGQIALGVARSGTESNSQIKIAGRDGSLLVDGSWPGSTVDDLVTCLMSWIDEGSNFGPVVAVGHRIVHGGSEYRDPVKIDDQVFEALEALVPLAPLHQPACLRPVRLVRELRPDLAQVACFDTAFHRHIVPPAGRYALPRKFETQGIRRYGFHGLSFESIAGQLSRDQVPDVRKERIIIAHLGNGASLCALHDLRSVDTTMGFSTLDGLVMGTRPGAIDPGILLYLMKEQGLSIDQLERLLYRQSGLLGVSGISSDVETLLSSDAPTAKEALELFAFQVARQTAALAATLGRLDRFIFTGGIGEHAPIVRQMIVDRLELFGAELDEERNSSGQTRISSDRSEIQIEQRPTQEEYSIARHVYARISNDSVYGARIEPKHRAS
jgi:acetate kinase